MLLPSVLRASFTSTGACQWCAVALWHAVCVLLCVALHHTRVFLSPLQGMLGITLVNLIPSIKPTKGGPDPPAGMDTTKAVFWAFMYLTALGSGGIKPCVSSFGGDQFKETSARER